MRVLVADYQQARADLHATAASGRGYSVDRARHGASALEASLERVPDVVICPLDLPVIDGLSLADILRGNPRTRHASFIFLVKDELDAPMALDPRDGTVVAPWHEEDVLDHIDAFIERNARFGESRSGTEIEGKLTQISLVDLLQIFQMNRRSGRLRLWTGGAGDESRSGSILVRDGQVIDGSVPLQAGSRAAGRAPHPPVQPRIRGRAPARPTVRGQACSCGLRPLRAPYKQIAIGRTTQPLQGRG